MSKHKILLLCARTARSAAYVQALANAGIVPDAVVLYGGASGSVSVTSTRSLEVQTLTGLFCPDVTEDVFETVKRLGWPLEVCPEKELTSPELLAVLQRYAPDIMVYSGYGGQIVPKSMLQQTKVLHIHSGWLPEFRGSTTLYHEVIEQGQCAASALFLDEQIDTGPVLKRKRYPMPPPEIDVDYLYDNAIRADLLVETLIGLIANKGLSPIATQASPLPPYFIIHPLLKHLALLTVDSKGKTHD